MCQIIAEYRERRVDTPEARVPTAASVAATFSSSPVWRQLGWP